MRSDHVKPGPAPDGSSCINAQTAEAEVRCGG